MGYSDRLIKKFESFSKDGGQTYDLLLGTEIKLLSDMPAYKVTELDAESNPPRIKLTNQSNDLKYTYLTGEPKRPETVELPRDIDISLEGASRAIVGRHPDSVAEIQVASVSRQHLSIHFDKRNKQFVMTPLNGNEGQICGAMVRGIEKATDILAAAATMMPGGLEENVETDVALRPGMTLQLLPHDSSMAGIPTYMVKTAISGVKPQLVLEMIGDTKGFSKAARIELVGKDAGKSIGSAAGNDVVIPHSQLSRLHANLYYDDSQKSWVYLTQSTPPVVGIGSQFLQDMHDRCERLDPKDKVATRAEIAEIDKLIADMQEARAGMPNAQELMRKVQGHEEATIFTPPDELERGGITEESQRGYRNWLHAYKLLYKEDLSARDVTALDSAMAAMNAMEQDRAVLRDIESYKVFPKGLPEKPAQMVAALTKANYNADMQEVVDRQLAPLKKIPPEPTVLVSGFRGHHTVTKIEKDKLGYKVTTYNAGAEAIDAGDGENVMAKYSQHLNRGVNVEDYIRLVNERKIRGMFAGESYTIGKVLESCVGKVEEFTLAPPQHKGNCTTRSTREMLRDMLEPERFAHMHRHVSNPDVCDPADIMAALQMRRDALAVAVPVEKPKDQQDWVQSVSEIHLSRSRSSHDNFSEMVHHTPAHRGVFTKI